MQTSTKILLNCITDFRSAKAVVRALRKSNQITKGVGRGCDNILVEDERLQNILEKIAVKHRNGNNEKTDTYNAMGGPIIDGVMFKHGRM